MFLGLDQHESPLHPPDISMRLALPVHLVLHILILAAFAENEETPATPFTQVSIRDVGFSLRRDSADLRAQQECPATHETADRRLAELSIEHAGITSTGPGLNRDEIDGTEAGDTDLISFEEWKRSKAVMEDDVGTVGEDERQDIPQAQPSASTSNDIVQPEKTDSMPLNGSKSANGSTEVQKVVTSHSKYNYASPDCSARIHSSSPQTQHATGLLHKSRDRYMLTPCKADQHWVIVELCDEIRMEAFEVSVWEFFSGVVREFRVSVGAEEESEWEEVGLFTGKNVRGAQVSKRLSAQAEY